MKMHPLGLLVMLIVATGIFAGVLFLGSGGDDWSPRNYVPANGDCFVPPQGDPLYDAHYAQEVNKYNCRAFVDQSQSKYIDAQSEQVRFETREGMFGVLVILGVVAGILLLLAIGILKGGSSGG